MIMKKPAIYERKKCEVNDLKKYYNISENEFLYYCDSDNQIYELERLVKDIINGHISYVKVKDITQISKDPHEYCEFIEFAENHDCKVYDRDGYDNHNTWVELIEKNQIKYIDKQIEKDAVER